jgi:acyl dehydratase
MGDGVRKRWLEDFEVGDKATFGLTRVSAEDIKAFARQFDPQPFHLDEEAGKATPFGGLVASGWHTAALCMRMMVDQMGQKSGSIGSPGVDELRWLKPVRPGDELSVRSEVLEVAPSRSKPDRGVLRVRYEVVNQSGESVMSMVALAMFLKDPTGGPYLVPRQAQTPVLGSNGSFSSPMGRGAPEGSMAMASDRHEDQGYTRAHFRLYFDPPDQPTFECKQGSYLVLDISEGGFRFALGTSAHPFPARMALEGNIVFPSNRGSVPVKGMVARQVGMEIAVQLQRGGQVPLNKIMEEQRLQIQRRKH